MKRIQLRYILLAVTALGLLVWGAAVTIPNSFTDGDVISASEMNQNFDTVQSAVTSNESDIATLQADQVGGAQSLESLDLALVDGAQSAAQVDLDAPAAGFALVMATTEVRLSHTTGTSTDLIFFGVSTSSTTVPADQDKDIAIPSGAPSGVYVVHAAAQRIFPVTAGTTTFHAVASKGTGDTIGLDGTVLTALYFPLAAGTVATTSVSPQSTGSSD